MRIYQLDTLSDDTSGSGRSVRMEQRFSYSHRRVRASALAIIGALLCTPFVLILSDFTARARLFDLMSLEPLNALQLGLVSAIGLISLYFGLSELSRPAIRKRHVTIEGGRAIVEDTMRATCKRWQEPVRSYEGIRHLVKTRSSGPIHVLMLEHKTPARSLCIAYETHIANQAIVDAGRQYDLPVLTNSGDGVLPRVGGLLPHLSMRWGRSHVADTPTARA